jgi:hypothetical protein
MTDVKDFMRAFEVSLKLQEGFDSIADVVGAEKAFYYFAGKVVEEGYDADTEERFVRLIRAAYDAYVADKGAA